MALTKEQREIALRVGRDIAQTMQLNEPEGFLEFATRLLAALPKPEPVAVCDTKNRIRWSGEDHNHRYSSAPSWVEVGTEFYATPQHDYKAQRDTERLDYLQVNGATVSLVHLKKPSDFEFCVGGLYKSINRDLRTAIDTAIASVKGGA